MEKETTEYGADVEIDQKTLDDYDSEEFDIGDAADGYETKAASEKGERESFFHPDEKLQDWDFGGLQMEKHSKSAHEASRKRKNDPQEESTEAEFAPLEGEAPEEAPEETPEEISEEASAPASEEKENGD